MTAKFDAKQSGLCRQCMLSESARFGPLGKSPLVSEMRLVSFQGCQSFQPAEGTRLGEVGAVAAVAAAKAHGHPWLPWLHATDTSKWAT